MGESLFEAEKRVFEITCDNEDHHSMPLLAVSSRNMLITLHKDRSFNIIDVM